MSSSDGRRSLASTSHATLNGFAELPLHYFSSNSSKASSIEHESPLQERDEFHSISSDLSSDRESDRASDDSHTTNDARDEEPHAITHDSKVEAGDYNNFVHAQTT